MRYHDRVHYNTLPNKAYTIRHNALPVAGMDIIHGNQLRSDDSSPIALNTALGDFESEKLRLEGLGLHVHSLCFSGPRGIYWSLSVTMQAWDSGNAGMH